MFSSPIKRRKIGKWTISLSEFSFQYVPQKAVKRQILVVFLVDHPYISIDEKALKEINISMVDVKHWEL